MNNKNFKDELIDSEIPFISVMNELHIEVFSDKKIIIDGECYVREYLTTFVSLSFKNGNIVITGDSLSIVSVSNEGVRITGKIYSINFERLK